jgi:hypothetical protein
MAYGVMFATICTNDLDDVILTVISMVPKGRDGIKDISNTCN